MPTIGCKPFICETIETPQTENAMCLRAAHRGFVLESLLSVLNPPANQCLLVSIKDDLLTRWNLGCLRPKADASIIDSLIWCPSLHKKSFDLKRTLNLLLLYCKL